MSNQIVIYPVDRAIQAVNNCEGGRVPTFTQRPPEHTLQVMLVLQTKICRHFQATGENLVDRFTKGKKSNTPERFSFAPKEKSKIQKIKVYFKMVLQSLQF